MLVVLDPAGGSGLRVAATGGAVMYLGCAVLAAFAFAVSTVLKHQAAQPTARPSRPGLLGLVVATVRHPRWLVGVGIDVAAVALQATALALGPIAVVQPVLSLTVVFVLLLAARGRPPARVLGWSAVLVLALAALVVLAGSTAAPGTADRLPAVVAGIVTLALVSSALGYGHRAPTGRLPACLLGLAAGGVYAVSAALLKALIDRGIAHGLLGVATSWQLYVLLVSGPVGMLLAQLSFRAGPVHQSLPATTAIDPIVSIVLGVLVFDETLRGGRLGDLALLAALIALVVAVRALARDAAGAADGGTHDPDAAPAQLLGAGTGR